METNEKNTYVELELNDGTKIQMTLQFYRLYQLKNVPERKADYKRYNSVVVSKGMKEEVDFIDVFYCAYLCANIQNLEVCISKDEFLKKFPENRKYIIRKYNELVRPKKN